jgi:ubiquitin-like-conjugating enzyme ATG3
MMEDIMQDYVDKTATIERHPFMSDVLTVSIHPCRHAQTMKRILGGMSVGTGAVVTLTVESYMPAFLKMLASMVPTLEYDYTSAVRL